MLQGRPGLAHSSPTASLPAHWWLGLPEDSLLRRGLLCGSLSRWPSPLRLRNQGSSLAITSLIGALHVFRLVSPCPACVWLQPGAPSNPRAAAEALVQALPSTPMLEGTPSLAGPGFINLKVTQDFLGQRITAMLKVVLATCCLDFRRAALHAQGQSSAHQSLCRACDGCPISCQTRLHGRPASLLSCTCSKASD